MTLSNRMRNLKALLLLGYIVVYLIDSFFHIKLWTALLAPVIVILYVISLPRVNNISKCISSVLIISGSYFLIKSAVPFDAWNEALVKNSGLTVLLLAVPMLSIIFYLVDFSSHITNFAGKHVKSCFDLYIFTFSTIPIFRDAAHSREPRAQKYPGPWLEDEPCLLPAGR